MVFTTLKTSESRCFVNFAPFTCTVKTFNCFLKHKLNFIQTNKIAVFIVVSTVQLLYWTRSRTTAVRIFLQTIGNENYYNNGHENVVDSASNFVPPSCYVVGIEILTVRFLFQWRRNNNLLNLRTWGKTLGKNLIMCIYIPVGYMRNAKRHKNFADLVIHYNILTWQLTRSKF